MKQLFNKTNGAPKLVMNDEDVDLEKYTEIQPPEGLYQPIYFDGENWHGVSKEEWLKQQPKVEIEEVPDEKDVVISDLTLQLMKTQDALANLQNDMANLTLQVMESDNNA
ncbi:hypothetical protein LZU21_07130 [Staphylococcus epidermidis]|jgi:hypothetical protein|uniref:hypothetical protein n=1 Tax=Staphylococcus epidermidis TaxID=1282 RepID=UPI002094D6E0|nr:hypothetical protein [Staphylococcus epidermidis]MCO6345118.1 hypothetical protein [Staphylococcus epidermidis]